MRDDRPLFLIGSPPCTALSPRQHLCRDKRNSREVADELRAGRARLRFCLELYLAQMAGNCFVIHELPSEATSWSKSSVLDVAIDPQGGMALVDMCMHGMRVKNGYVEGLARKRMRLTNNSHEVPKRVENHCTNDHQHVLLDQGRAKKCQVYPCVCCRKVCDGIAAEKRE